MNRTPTNLLLDLFRSAVDAVSPVHRLPGHLPDPPKGRTIVVGTGKAAASMAKVIEDSWQKPLSGVVVTRYGHAMSCDRIDVIEAGHPMPDEAGRDAAERILTMVRGLTPDDLVLCLISGGGSALLALPAQAISLTDKQAVNGTLLRSGATISEINCVRKHLSRIKGGRLAAACAPARVVSLLISDVPGNDPAVIASGPTVPDPSTRAEALAVLSRYGIDGPASVVEYLRSEEAETPKPGDPVFDRTTAVVVASSDDALRAAAGTARMAGIEPVVLGDVEGEARRVGVLHAHLARQFASRPIEGLSCVLISGGETTVTVCGNGRGGRNAEFLLALAIDLAGHPGIYALACDTDGIDGTEDNAGCLLRPDTLSRARQLGLDAEEHLNDNNAYEFFSALDDLVVTGPTRTNVNDFRAILVTAEAARS